MSTEKKIYLSTDYTGEAIAPHQYFVTDADGKSKWEEKLAYAYTGMVEILPETVIPINNYDNPFKGQFTEPLSEGNEYTVHYNGIAYKCVAQPFDRGDGVENIALGNIGALVGGNDTREPFVLFIFPPALASEFAGSLVAFDGAKPVTLSITGVVEKVKTIDPKFLPGSSSGGGAATAIPSYVREEAMDVLDKVVAAQGSRTFTLGAIADMHYGSSDYIDGVIHATQGLRHISERIKLDAIAVLGDYTDEHQMDTDTAVTDLEEMNALLDPLRHNVNLRLKGNHDHRPGAAA